MTEPRSPVTPIKKKDLVHIRDVRISPKKKKERKNKIYMKDDQSGCIYCYLPKKREKGIMKFRCCNMKCTTELHQYINPFESRRKMSENITESVIIGEHHKECSMDMMECCIDAFEL